MLAISGMRRRPPTGTVTVLLIISVALAVFTTGAPATAGPPAAAGETYVKYYRVMAAYQGAPENLSEIAGRFLTTTARSGEIFQLNAGVVQADGGQLTDPAVLHAGWVLTLPWDAVGTGVQYGLLPTATAPATTAPSVKKPAGSSSVKPSASTSSGTVASSGGCAGSPKNAGGAQSQWAMLRLAPDHAWAYSRGGGVMVAVVDSGVDATRPELAGRVTVGADIIAGTGRGDVDCLGTGTAMAGIVAAKSDASAGTFGMAPDTTVMPVRIAPTSATVSEADQASAIEVAVSAGAKVIALGGHVDLSKPAVASVVEFATGHDVLVVAGAAVRSGTAAANSAGGASAGLLRVGAINIDGEVAATYQPGAVDVVAPGVDVMSLGISGTGQVLGTGTPYAVAFVAGEAALVRSMYPHLTVAQVVRRIEATADRMGSTAPDATFGWGLIDPGAAVTRVIPDEGRGPAVAPAAPSTGWSSLRTRALIVVIVLALLMVLLLVLRIRRMVRVAPLADPGRTTEPVASPGPTRPAAPGQVDEAGDGELVTAGAPTVAGTWVTGMPAVAGTSAVAGVSGHTGTPAVVGASARGSDGRGDEAATPFSPVVRQTPARLTGSDEDLTGPADGRTGPADGWWRHGPNGA